MKKTILSPFLYFLYILSLTIFCLFTISCNDSGSDATSDDEMSISGTLDSSQSLSLSLSSFSSNPESSSAGKIILNSSPNNLPIRTASVDYTTYSIRCVTLSGTLKAATSQVSTNGTFSLNLSVTKGQPIGCFIITSSDSSIIASLTFKSSGLSIDGSTDQKSGSYISKGGNRLNLGAIAFDADQGIAIVDTSSDNFSESGGSTIETNFFDTVEGTWTLKAITQTGYNEKPEEIPPSIFLNEITAEKDGNQIKGISVWMSDSVFQACGSNEGMTSCPTGFSSCSSDMTGSFFLDPLPALAIISNEYNTCGNTSEYCDGISTNTQSWGNTSITFNADDCKAICFASNLWETLENSFQQNQSSCIPDVKVNWSKYQSATSAGNLSCATTGSGIDYCGTGNAEGFVVRHKPKGRFFISPFKIEGSVATGSSIESETHYPCVYENPNQNCTQIQCQVIREETVTFTKTGTNTATIEVRGRSFIGTNSNTLCFQDIGGNYLYQEANEKNFMLMAATKSSTN